MFWSTIHKSTLESKKCYFTSHGVKQLVRIMKHIHEYSNEPKGKASNLTIFQIAQNMSFNTFYLIEPNNLP
jgi:hypothetical protein